MEFKILKKLEACSYYDDNGALKFAEDIQNAPQLIHSDEIDSWYCGDEDDIEIYVDKRIVDDKFYSINLICESNSDKKESGKYKSLNTSEYPWNIYLNDGNLVKDGSGLMLLLLYTLYDKNIDEFNSVIQYLNTRINYERKSENDNINDIKIKNISLKASKRCKNFIEQLSKYLYEWYQSIKDEKNKLEYLLLDEYIVIELSYKSRKEYFDSNKYND